MRSLTWSDTLALYEGAKGEPDGTDLWAMTGAMIGAARLAKLHGDDSMMNEAAGYASAGLQRAASFAQLMQSAVEKSRVQTFVPALAGYDPNQDMGSRVIARGLAREVLIAMRTTPSGRRELSDYFTRLMHHNDYTFGPENTLSTELIDGFATEHGGWSASEGGATVPEISWAMFLAHAYGLGSNQNKLRPALDVAWCRADLMQLDKLVAAIEATPGDAAPPPVDFDAGVVPAPADSGSAVAKAASPQSDSGCGCRASGEPPRHALFGLALCVATLAVRRAPLRKKGERP